MTNEENSKPQNDVQKKNGAQGGHDDESAPDHAGVSGRGTLITVGVLLVVVAVLALVLTRTLGLRNSQVI